MPSVMQQQRWSNLADRDHKEGSSSSGFDDDGDEFGADRTQGTVPGNAGHSDVVDAVFGLPRLSKNVAEFALPDHASPERHICGDEKNKNRTKSQEKGITSSS